MKKVKNETTGGWEMQFGATLISMSEKVLTNVNKKNYKVATIEFVDVHGEIQRTSAIVYEGNYKNEMKVGGLFLATATPSEQGVFIKVSHLDYNGERATDSMFGFDVEEISAEMVPNTAFEEQS